VTDEELKTRLIRLETRFDESDKNLGRMGNQLDELVADLRRREGRDKFFQIDHREEREDKWQRNAWIRSFLPTGLFTMLWLAFAEAVREIFYRGGG